MSAQEIDACDRYEFEEKMRWIDADRRVDKWLKIHNITGDDEEDFLRRYHAKYGKGQESRANGESASSTSSPPAAMPETTISEQEIFRILDDLTQRAVQRF
jgi:hypothetical protein